MNKFIKNALKFCFVIIFSATFVFVLAFVISSTKNIFSPSFVESKVNIFILGDSNTECAINDSLFLNSKNLSSSGEPYFESFSKIQKLLLENIRIDYIFLSYAPHNFYECPFPDRRRDYKYISFETFKILFNYKKNKFQFVKSVIKDKLKIHFKINGSFRYLERNDLENHKLSLLRGENLTNFPNKILSKNTNHKVNQNQRYFFEKIISICNENGINLILLNTPKRKELINDKRYCYDKFNNYYLKNHSEIPYIDHTNFELNENYFGDFVHLNYKGAKKYSTFLNELFYSSARSTMIQKSKP